MRTLSRCRTAVALILPFNEDTRVKLPAILHLTRPGFRYLSLKNAEWDIDTDIFVDLFSRGTLFCLLALMLCVNTALGIELPAPLSETEPELKLVGQARHTFLGFKVYDVALYAPGLPVTSNSTAVLSIHYHMSVTSKGLQSLTLKEWKRMGTGTESQREIWLKQLNAIWPDVKSGQNLSAFRIRNGPTRFFMGNRELGQIDDPVFGWAFLSIWLGPDCSKPRLRDRLIQSE